MAKLVNGILGGFSGKVGTVVGACWKGIDYIRSLAASITNPRTPAQLEQRARFTLIITFLRSLTAFLRIGFRGAALKMSAFNAAMAYNVKNAIKGTYPNYEIDFTKVLLAQGSLAGALNPAVDSTTPGKVDFTWADNSDQPNAMEDDQAFLVVHEPISKRSFTILGGAARQALADSITLPEYLSGTQVHCYIGFTNANESEVSDSVYVAALIVA
ncbi:MAG TPA: DUF6266 family protein [Prolixibacteraceae bacterium]|nr:DUF6266 family protein [Prolixibacteraceae bacterium]